MLMMGLALAAADPVPPTPPAEASVQAAVRVVQHYYAALGRHDYRTAHALWPRGPGIDELRRGYAHTAWTRVTPLPPFTSEGGAGSVYAQIKVKVDSAQTDGTRQHFTGSYTLRRVNDVEGSTAAQRRWHIESGKLVRR
ncbi:hypothetical protein [Sphingomonas sp. MMS24-J13]|uniref:hypothetical protein n=1 Tax=Sphingomonas sp. MMS24-J13 TaxID=3238686 RepID=UPI00384AF10D